MSRTVRTFAHKHAFAPLRMAERGSDDQASLMQLKGIVFDMDGTLCEPQNYMFGEMRSAVQIPKGTDILDHIHALPEKEQTEAFAMIQAIEEQAMARQVPQAGLVSLMEYLDENKIKKAICTRNFDNPVNHLLNHIPGHISAFAPIVTRDFRPPKPSPEGILHIACAWGVADDAVGSSDCATAPPLPIIMVGDSIDDITAGHDAGALTVLLRSEGKEELETDERTDVVISRLDELIGLLRDGIQAR